MKRLLKYTLVVITILSAFSSSYAADTVKVYFRVGHSQFDPSFDNNGNAMKLFLEKVKEAAAENIIDSIIIHGAASPDGGNLANERLAVKRGNVIADYIVSRTGVNRKLVTIIPQGIAWGELRNLVAETPGVPYREKVLDILDNTPIWIYDSKGTIISGRKKKLMDLKGGRPYNWLYTNLFPKLRNAMMIALVLKTDNTDSASDASENQNSDLNSETHHSPAGANISQDKHSDTSHENTDKADASDNLNSLSSTRSAILKTEKLRRFALKTNLIYDALLMPNLELEWQFNKHWSVAIDGGVAWWSRSSRNRYYRLATISPEVRYYFKPIDYMHGFYAGALVAGGLYQLQTQPRRGYRGEGFMGGITAGYMWPISRTLSFDAEIGLGYMYTRYKEYEPQMGHKLYLFTKSLNYFGPVKIKFSLAWRFSLFTKSVINNSAL